MRRKNSISSHISFYGGSRISPCARSWSCEVTPLGYHGAQEIIIFLGTSIYLDFFTDTYHRYISPLSPLTVLSPYFRYQSPPHLDTTVKCYHPSRTRDISRLSSISWKTRSE